MPDTSEASATATSPDATAPLCSKCGKNPRAYEDSTNPWCRSCLAEYQSVYRKLLLDQKFQRGVAEMRRILVEEFTRLRIGSFTGEEVAYLIQNAKGPV